MMGNFIGLAASPLTSWAAEEASGHSEAPPSHWGGRTLLDWWVATWDGNSCKGVSDLFENNQISMQVELLSMWSKWYSIHWIGVVKTYSKPWFFQVFSSFPHQIPDLFPRNSRGSSWLSRLVLGDGVRSGRRHAAGHHSPRSISGSAREATCQTVSGQQGAQNPIVDILEGTLWLCQNSYWKWPFIVDFPIENGDFP